MTILLATPFEMAGKNHRKKSSTQMKKTQKMRKIKGAKFDRKKDKSSRVGSKENKSYKKENNDGKFNREKSNQPNNFSSNQKGNIDNNSTFNKHKDKKTSKFTESHREKFDNKPQQKSYKDRKAENHKHKIVEKNPVKENKTPQKKEKIGEEPVSKLKEIFYNGKDEDMIKDFENILTRDILKEEISFFGYIVKQKEYDRALVIFLAENITKHATKQNLIVFLNICFTRIFCEIRLKKSIFLLRLLLILTKIENYIPMSIQLINIYKIAQKSNPVGTTDKNIDFDRLKLTTEILESSQLKDFLLEESLALLFANLNSISNCSGFPEISEPIILSLKNLQTDDDLDLYDFIDRIKSQKLMIEKKRQDFSFTCYEDLVEFEKSTAKMIE